MKVDRNEVTSKLMFALNIVYAIEMISKYENHPKTATAALAVILQELGYSQEDSYSAAATMEITNQFDLLTRQDITVALPSLVDIASNCIDKDLVPEFVREQVKKVLETL